MTEKRFMVVFITGGSAFALCLCMLLAFRGEWCLSLLWLCNFVIWISNFRYAAPRAWLILVTLPLLWLRLTCIATVVGMCPCMWWGWLKTSTLIVLDADPTRRRFWLTERRGL